MKKSFLIIAGMLLAGCQTLPEIRADIEKIINDYEIATRDKKEPIPAPTPSPVPEPKPAPLPVIAGDDLDPLTIQDWGVPNWKMDKKGLSTAKVTAKFNRVTSDRRMIWFDYDYKWANDPSGCNGVAILAYRKDGRMFAGKFDWIRNGGQGNKELKNALNGYAGHVVPAKGSDMWAAWYSIDGKERTNFKKVDWK